MQETLKSYSAKSPILFMKHNQIVFSLSLIYFEHESLWHQVHELDYKNTDSLISGEVKF